MAERKLRVHMLAKELSVSSKAIIEKCRAEDIEVKNHMHVLTAGLAATVREWFSEGAHTTTIEESARVDLKKVRVKARRKAVQKIAEASAGDGSQAVEAGVAVLDAPPDTATEKIDTAETRPAAEAAASDPRGEPDATDGVAVVDTQSDAEIGVLPPADAAEAVPAPDPDAVVDRPDPAVDPGAGTLAAAAEVQEAGQPPPAPAASEAAPIAGPQNVPMPAKLQGPRVVRMERPDDVAAPRRAPRPLRGPPRPPSGPEARPSDDGSRARRTHGRGQQRESTEGATAAGRRSPRRSARDGRVISSEHLREWKDRDLIERRERLDHATGRGIGGLKAIEGKQTRRTGGRQVVVHAKKDKIELTEPILVKDFSREAGITINDIVSTLMREHDTLVGAISTIDSDVAQLLAADFGLELVVQARRSGLDRLAEEFAALERKQSDPRPPVVTVLGHVDHGKTSLLDRIRKTNVAAGEDGGITQHVGAHRVKVGEGWVTFLDTPGHRAFTAMRARGANMTDVVVLVVAADDGVMPTTIEAINHAKAAGATIVVALNKIDLPHDINKIYAQLTEHGLTPSGEWGGETDVVKTSAVSGEGIDDLLAHLSTLSEVMDLRADPTIPANGTVIEAERKAGVGHVARLLVQEGVLKPGQFIVCGAAYGRVRSIRDDRGKATNKAGPSTPVEVAGLSEGAEAGDRFYVVKTAPRAKEIAEEVAAHRRESALIRIAKPTSLESMLAATVDGSIPELQVILKADVQGSIDVLKSALSEFPRDRVKLNVLHDGVGAVNESDVALAQASRAIIIGFHVVSETGVDRMADGAGVSIRTYRVIYNVIDDIRKALEEQLPPEEKIESRGQAVVREIFSISKIGKIAGCLIRDGSVARNHMVRVVRDGVIVKDRASIESLRRFKDDAKEVKAGLECGIRVSRFDDVKPGDIIESYEVLKIPQTLE